ncbi:carbohydrate ABC transporter permease [Paenibacillus radicis (ex Xue et al. 2023)]|uniref:Sugar ABC transporter permease n=1 Tax=Paenibacillus radicis (ex Xue et al. 2023) TaxID=2972489 RepID=A0ABT1YH81_9BACL|nr:sugar ABC transporter permease [Paenibacillus radicis (ex Xue et al. 2023)]MCR8632543.1 sugar ABC transporter permease [Paenibacillus radicis (ex Xue et al. 2023)]
MRGVGNKTFWRSDNTAGYVFIFPWLFGFLAFSIIPIAASLYLAFTKYDILSPPEWVGLDNFKEMFMEDSRYWISVKATLIFVFTAVPLRLCFALAVAMLLNMKLKFLGFFRATYYLPTLIGGSVAVSVMWRQLFGASGAFNSFLEASFGITEKVSWITHPSTALLSLIVLSVWQFGSSMLIFLAGLKQIPAELYEAAQVDGANAWRKFKSITLPLLTPVIFFNLVMGIINGFKVFTEGMIVTGGGPFDKTLFYVLYLYEKSFRYYEMGYGSSMAWVLLLMIAFFTAVVFKTSKHWVHYESKGD